MILESVEHKGEYVFVSRTGRPYQPGGLRSIIRRRAEAIGSDVRTVYGLRHSRAQSILEAGYRLEDVAAWLGHRRVSTTQIYAQVRADRVRELAETVASPLPDGPVAPARHRTGDARTRTRPARAASRAG